MFSLSRRSNLSSTEERYLRPRITVNESNFRRSHTQSLPKARVIDEIISSEQAYVNFLRILSDHFEIPLRLNHMLPSDIHNAIFRNLQAILRLNEELYHHLSSMEIGEAFLEMAPFLKLYSHYARHHYQALMILQEWQSKSAELNEFVTSQEQKPSVSLKLNALLIMPVQRIPRYEMLLRELLRLTPPNVYPGEFDSLSRALDAVVDVACHINEHVRLAEHSQHMNRIQARLTGRIVPRLIAPGRRFIKEGVLTKISRRGGSAHIRVFFLFSDILMYAKPAIGSASAVSENCPANSTSKLECCSILPLHHCKAERLFGVTQDANALMFKISCKRTTLILFAPEREIGEAWINVLETSIRKVQNDRLTLRKESSAKEPMRASQFNKMNTRKRKIEEESLKESNLLTDNCFSPKRSKHDTSVETPDCRKERNENPANQHRCIIL